MYRSYTVDAYRTPTADVRVESPKEYKPLVGLLIGLFFTIIIMSITSGGVGFIFGTTLGADFSGQNWNKLLAASNSYLLTDIVVSAIVCFYAGRAIGKRTPGKEIKFGFLLASINIAIYLPMYIYSDAFTTYPSWYNTLTFVINFLFIALGAKRAANT
jgi:hypothetical protein